MNTLKRKAQDILPKFDLEVFNNDINYLRQKNENIFPLEVFPNKIQQIIRMASESLKFSPDILAAGAIYAASVAIGNTYKAKIIKGYTQSAVVYMAIVASRGDNKTHPLNFMLRPIKQRDEDNYNVYLKQLAEYEHYSSLSVKEKKEYGVKEVEQPHWRQVLVADTTPEGLTDVHFHNLRGIGAKVDELKGWFKNFNRYNKGSEEEFWLSSWSGEEIRINRKSSPPILIKDPFISVIGTTQTEVLESIANGRIVNGFFDRILFIIPHNLKKEPLSDNNIDESVILMWSAIINKIMDVSYNNQTLVIGFDEEGKKFWINWQNKLAQRANEDRKVKPLLAKLEPYSIRFALILELLKYGCSMEELPSKISFESVNSAIILTDYFFNTALMAQDIVDRDDPVSKLPAKKTELYDSLPNEFSTGEGVEIAKTKGLSERTFKSFIQDKKFFSCVAHGKYRKEL